MHMHRALRHAGRAGRIEPVRDLISTGSGGCRAFVLGRQQRVQPRHRRRASANDDNFLDVGQILGGFLHHREQRGRNKDRLGSRIFEKVAILVDRQPRVDQNGYNTRPDGPPEQHGKVDGIEQNESDPVFRFNPHACQHRADARRGIAQFAIGQVARGVDERGLLAPSLGDVAIHEIDSGIIVANGGHSGSLPFDIADKSCGYMVVIELSHLALARMMRASTARQPSSSARQGLRSTSSICGCSSSNWPRETNMAAMASTLSFLRPRAPAMIFGGSVSWMSARACSMPNGARRKPTRLSLSLIHISEPTRQAEISYAVF